jgi:hypothetical protein
MSYRDIPVFVREAPRNLVLRDELKLTWDEVSKYRLYGYPDPLFYIFRIYRLYPDRNSTSIVVRRELMDRHKDILNGLVYEIDNFLFAAAVADKVPCSSATPGSVHGRSTAATSSHAFSSITTAPRRWSGL